MKKLLRGFVIFAFVFAIYLINNNNNNNEKKKKTFFLEWYIRKYVIVPEALEPLKN